MKETQENNGCELLKSPERSSHNLIVLRREHCGLLIWSYEKDSYFLISDPKQSESVLDTVRNQKFNSLNEKVRSEFDSIGLNHKAEIRIIDQPIENRLSAPLDFYFDYTWACNLRCPDCYNRDVARGITMSNDKVSAVFAEMARNGIMRTHLAGGEPTLLPHNLKNYLDSAAHYGIRTSVNTNGTNFTPEVAKTLFESDLVSLTFSVDGSQYHLHDRLRGLGNFAITTEAIRRAVQLKRENQSKTQLQIKTVWFPDTSDSELEAMVILGMELGVDVVQFHNPERCLYHERGYYGRVRNQYYERLSFINKLIQEYNGQIKIWNVCNPLASKIPVGIPHYHGCIGSQELIALNPNGMMTPCLMNPEALGNLFEDWGGSFADFWRTSEKLAQFQHEIQQVDDDCVGCHAYDYCRGGSKVRSQVEHGSFAKKDPFCPTDYVKSLGQDTTTALGIKDRRLQGTYEHFIAIAVTHSL